MKWFATLIIVGLALPAWLLVGSRYGTVDKRVAELETWTRTESRRVARVQEELSSILGELHSIEEEVRSTPTEQLTARLLQAEDQLYDLGETLVVHDERIGYLDRAQDEFGPAVLEARLELLDQTQEERLRSVTEVARTASERANESMQQLHELTEADLEAMWGELIGPVVQLAGDTSVGSGVLLESVATEDPDVWRTHILTAWHVVRDIQDEPGNPIYPVPVTIYTPTGGLIQETATLLVYDADIDAALLELDRGEPVEFGTRLAPRTLLHSVRTFEPVFAVGCPLGNDPIPTRGEVASPAHMADGVEYWMINAPTYIGNSGGAIYHGRTHELLGIFSKIYTHGSLRPTVVPHMGLVTPLTAIYDWLDGEGYGYLEPAGAAWQQASADH